VTRATCSRLSTEFTGTGLLVAVVVGSGIAAIWLTQTLGCGCSSIRW
jgi:hypothetical protein